MATGDNRTNFQQKRFLPQQRLEDSFFDYLDSKLDDLTARIWGSQRGVFGSLSLAADGNDKFKATSLPTDLLDADGRILTLEADNGEGIEFENENAIPYYVGARFVKVPSGVIRNPRNDVIFYDQFEDEIGESANPDSIVETAGTLEIVVDSIFESGVDHSGRKVTVYLEVPKSDVETVAIERNLFVTWDGSNNKITTAALLGQTGGSASTTPSEYTVIAQGLTVRRNTNLSATSPYAFIGIVTGAGAGSPPSVFSTTGQIDVSDGINPDLQEAYTVGRVITPSSAYGGALKVESLDSGDAFKSLVHLNRDGATETDPIGLASVSDDREGAAVASLKPLIDFATSYVSSNEPAALNASAGVLDLTRVGVDLTQSAAGVSLHYDVAVLDGFPTAAVNGMYLISAVAAAQVTLKTFALEAAPGTWPVSETGTVTFYRIRFKSGSDGFGYNGAVTRREGLMGGENTFSGRPSTATESEAAVKVLPGGSARSLEIYDDSATPELKYSVEDTGAAKYETAGQIDSRENYQLKLSRFGNTDDMQFMLIAEAGDESSIPIAVVQKVRGVSGIVEDNAVSASAGILTFTGVGVDLEADALRLNEKWNLVLVHTAGTEADHGIFLIDDPSAATTLPLYRLGEATAVSWVANGVKTASILQVLFWIGGSNINATTGDQATWLQGITMMLRGGEQDNRPLRILPHGCTGEAIQIYDNDVRSGGHANGGARIAMSYHPDQTQVSLSSAFRFFRPAEIHGQIFGVTGGGGAANTWALKLQRGGGTPNTTTPGICLHIDDGNAGTQPEPGQFKGGLTAENVPIRGHHFRDDFHYQFSGTSNGPIPKYSLGTVGTSSTIRSGISTSDLAGCGSMELVADGSLDGDYAGFGGAKFARISQARGFQWRFSALFALENVGANTKFWIGMFDNNSDLDAYFITDPTINSGRWTFRYQDETQAFVNVDTGITPVAGRYYWGTIHQLGTRTWSWAIMDKSTGATGIEDVGDALAGAPTEYNFANATPTHQWALNARITTVGTPGGTQAAFIDMWELIDVGNPTYAKVFNVPIASPV